MYLLDTNVLSELRKRDGRRDNSVEGWFASVPRASTAISAISILELEEGALRMNRRDPVQGAVLLVWVERLVQQYASRILAADANVARRCAALHVPDPRPERDALIAATALVHGLTVVTRDVKYFAPMGVPLLNPWEWVQ